MTESLEEELSRRARYLLRTRAVAKKSRGITILYELVLPELIIDASVGGTLMIDVAVSGKMVYMASPNGTTMRTSPDDELAAAVKILRNRMILDDLANV